MKEDRTGEKHTTNEGYEVEIVEYFGWDNCTIKFNSTNNTLKNLQYKNVKMGQIKNPLHKSLYGVGYLGEGLHKPSSKGIHTNMYNTWKGILTRSYSKDYQSKRPTYTGCSVDERWHNFQNFAKWYEENYKPEFMGSWHLDKDILFKGNKIYSPSTCCFVPYEINCLFTKNNKDRGKYPIGVCKQKEKFLMQVNLGRGITKRLLFNTLEETFNAYKITKENYIKKIANKWKNKITEVCYKTLLNYNVEITD